MSTKQQLKNILIRGYLFTISINNFSVHKTLIDLGAAINVMTTKTMKYLKLPNILPTTAILELVDISKVVPEGIL